MRRNNTQRPSSRMDRFDHVYIDIPQYAWLRSMVAEPLKTVYHNRAAEPYANIDQMFRNVDALENFVSRHGIELF